NEDFPVPQGFSEQDVNLDAPPLFTDTFCLFYLLEMTIHGLSSYGISLPVSTRRDIRDYYVQCNTSSMELFNQITDLMLEKGIYQKPPNIPTPTGITFVQDKSFMNAWVGDRRPLNVIEISEVYFNVIKNMLSKTLYLAYHQVAPSTEVKKFISSVVDLSNKHIEELGAKLQKDNLPIPTSYDDQITNSTTSPFSERLIMYHIGFLSQTALAYFGSGMAISMRPDLAAQ